MFIGSQFWKIYWEHLLQKLLFGNVATGVHLCNVRVQTCIVYLKCENVIYWYTIVIGWNQLTIFIPRRSTTIADYSDINYLLQVLVLLAKIGFFSIASESKMSKFNIFKIIFF